MIKIGQIGTEVMEVQKMLNRLGFGLLKVDGAFGHATDQEIRRFQAHKGIGVDGVVGPETVMAFRHALSALSEQESPAPQVWTPGLDVSSYQPNVNWEKVAEGGYKFVFIKASEGTWLKDREHHKAWPRTKEFGLLRGAYHFFRPQLDAILQAEKFLSVGIEDSELPPVLDLESRDGVASGVILSKAIAWLDHVERHTGRKPIVYTGLGFQNSIGNPAPFGGYPLWCAQYGPKRPSKVRPWTDWKFWQWSCQCRIPGIVGGVDANWFNGGYEDLLRFAHGR